MEQPLQQQHHQTVASEGLGGAETVRDTEDLQLVGVPVGLAADADVAEREGGCALNLEVAAVADGGALKRKRGRPAKGVPKAMTAVPPARQKKEEEDVCFICFDGGSLVLCDRRGCPKAYHPACIKRDEAFFRSKAKWNCGWHICSVCQKTSHYVCYTCPYSLCKGCTRNADFVSIRGNKGLCGMCMRTIMLIENPAEGNKATCEVDFDDKSSWEYLFKVYWVCLKEKLSLTLDDLLRAKNPWKAAPPIRCKVETPHELYHLNDSGSENSCIDRETNNLKNKKPKRRDKQRFIWDGVSNDVGYSKQDLPISCELIGNTCMIKNHINPNDLAVVDRTSVGAVKSEASGVALDMSSLLFSTGMEQPFNDFVNDKSWHYQDPTGKVQGPFSMVQLCKWNASGHFPPDLRIWRIGERQDNSVLLTDALSGKCSINVSLPCNSQLLSLGASVTLDNKDNVQDGGRNETRTEIHSDSQIIKQSGVQKVDDTCTQSNGKDESVRSNGLHSSSSSWTIAADGNNNEGQSGNFERREESSKCEISCHDQPHSLPSTAFLEKLIENPSDILRDSHGIEGHSEDNGNHGLNGTPEGQSNSGQSYQKQSESEENSGQSSGQNWECPQIIHPTCNTSMWQAIFGEPTDFSSLVDESVSDLLAEVEAMESLGAGGLDSPTSIMKCDDELTDGSKNDCLSFALGLGPMLDAGKGDALSSTGDIHLASQSTAAEEAFRHADVHHHHQRIRGEHSSRSSEVESTFSRISWNPTNQYSWDPKC